MRSNTNVVVTAAVNFANFESWLLFLVKCFAVCAVELCSHGDARRRGSVARTVASCSFFRTASLVLIFQLIHRHVHVARQNIM